MHPTEQNDDDSARCFVSEQTIPVLGKPNYPVNRHRDFDVQTAAKVYGTYDQESCDESAIDAC